MKGLLIVLSALLPSCAYLPRAPQVPIATLERGVAESRELVVFLPGRWSTLGEFEREGFFEIAAEKWPSARLVAADLHLGYYKGHMMPGEATRRHHPPSETFRRDEGAAGGDFYRWDGRSSLRLGASRYRGQDDPAFPVPGGRSSNSGDSSGGCIGEMGTRRKRARRLQPKALVGPKNRMARRKARDLSRLWNRGQVDKFESTLRKRISNERPTVMDLWRS